MSSQSWQRVTLQEFLCVWMELGTADGCTPFTSSSQIIRTTHIGHLQDPPLVGPPSEFFLYLQLVGWPVGVNNGSPTHLLGFSWHGQLEGAQSAQQFGLQEGAIWFGRLRSAGGAGEEATTTLHLPLSFQYKGDFLWAPCTETKGMCMWLLPPQLPQHTHVNYIVDINGNIKELCCPALIFYVRIDHIDGSCARYGAGVGGTKSNTINLIVRLYLYLKVMFWYFFTYN